MTRETLQQFERLQRESELIVEALRNVVPTITTSPPNAGSLPGSSTTPEKGGRAAAALGRVSVPANVIVPLLSVTRSRV